MQISTCARLPSSHAFARLSLQRQAVVGKKTSSSSPQQKAGVSSARNPAQSGFRSNGRKLKCKAATEDVDDIIDVEGKTIDDRIPVTVITGFLGSGKTTLLNRILTADHGHRIAVIENEFGEIDIDSDLVSIREDLDPENEQILMLNNGCLCCTVRDDLVQMLNKLHQQRDKFDRVVIETTGLANPAPIIQTFFLEPSVADHMKLDGVLTLVDAKHVEQHLDEIKPDGVVNEAIEQVAFADRIVLNKTDLVSPKDLERLEQRIKGINAMAEIRKTQRADVPLDYVLGVGGFDLEKIEDDIAAFDARKAKEAAEKEHKHEHKHDDHECSPGCTHSSHAHDSHSHSHSHDHEHSHSHDAHDSHESHSHDSHDSHDSHSHDHSGHSHEHDHVHDDSVTSVSVTVDGDLDLDQVNYWLGGLLEIKSNDMYRMKGVLSIDGFDRRFVFQGVHMLFEGMPDRLWKDGEERKSRMVFIGKDLDAEVIKEGFEHCLVRKREPEKSQEKGFASSSSGKGKKKQR